MNIKFMGEKFKVPEDKEYSLTAKATKDKPSNKTAKTILVVFALGIVVSIVAIFVLLNYVGII